MNIEGLYVSSVARVFDNPVFVDKLLNLWLGGVYVATVMVIVAILYMYYSDVLTFKRFTIALASGIICITIISVASMSVYNKVETGRHEYGCWIMNGFNIDEVKEHYDIVYKRKNYIVIRDKKGD